MGSSYVGAGFLELYITFIIGRKPTTLVVAGSERGQGACETCVDGCHVSPADVDGCRLSTCAHVARLPLDPPPCAATLRHARPPRPWSCSAHGLAARTPSACRPRCSRRPGSGALLPARSAPRPGQCDRPPSGPARAAPRRPPPPPAPCFVPGPCASRRSQGTRPRRPRAFPGPASASWYVPSPSPCLPLVVLVHAPR